jgi:hypothetical protein
LALAVKAAIAGGTLGSAQIALLRRAGAAAAAVGSRARPCSPRFANPVPDALAYGDRGRLAHHTLIFDVELISVGDKQPFKAPAEDDSGGED